MRLLLSGLFALSLAQTAQALTIGTSFEPTLDEATRKKLSDAVTTLQARLNDPKLIECLSQATQANISSKYIKEIDYRDTEIMRAKLMSLQVYWLMWRPAEFPKLRIKVIEEQNELFGQPVNSDVFTFIASERPTEGTFSIVLNRQGREDRFDDVDRLAGEIMHLMTHNLGHLHGEKPSMDLQIMTLQACIATNMKYERGSHFDAGQCGAK